MRVTLRTKRIKATEFQCRKCSEPIKPGDKYYEWKHNHAPVSRQHQSHGAPRTSELCTGKMSGVYAAIESVEDAVEAARKSGDASELAGELESAAESVREVATEYEESLGNMPESLQQSSSGESIQEKVDALNEFADSLESAASDSEITEWDMDEESPELGEDHADNCALNDVVEEVGEANDEDCNCGYAELQEKKETWEEERDNKLESACSHTEEAVQELSI